MIYSCPPVVAGVAYPFYLFFKNFLKNSVSLGGGSNMVRNPRHPVFIFKIRTIRLYFLH